jgi:hypothetical protein
MKCWLFHLLAAMSLLLCAAVFYFKRLDNPMAIHKIAPPLVTGQFWPV